MKIYRIEKTRADNSQYNVGFYRTYWGVGLWDIITEVNKEIAEENKKEPDNKKWSITEIKRINKYA